MAGSSAAGADIRIWNGTLSTVPSTVKLRVSRNVGEALCLLDNRDLRLLPNVNVGVTIVTAEHSGVLTLQREALRIDDSKPYVFQVVDGQLRRRVDRPAEPRVHSRQCRAMSTRIAT